MFAWAVIDVAELVTFAASRFGMSMPEMLVSKK